MYGKVPRFRSTLNEDVTIHISLKDYVNMRLRVQPENILDLSKYAGCYVKTTDTSSCSEVNSSNK